MAVGSVYLWYVPRVGLWRTDYYLLAPYHSRFLDRISTLPQSNRKSICSRIRRAARCCGYHAHLGRASPDVFASIRQHLYQPFGSLFAARTDDFHLVARSFDDSLG